MAAGKARAGALRKTGEPANLPGCNFLSGARPSTTGRNGERVSPDHDWARSAHLTWRTQRPRPRSKLCLHPRLTPSAYQRAMRVTTSEEKFSRCNADFTPSVIPSSQARKAWRLRSQRLFPSRRRNCGFRLRDEKSNQENGDMSRTRSWSLNNP